MPQGARGLGVAGAIARAPACSRVRPARTTLGLCFRLITRLAPWLPLQNSTTTLYWFSDLRAVVVWLSPARA